MTRKERMKQWLDAQIGEADKGSGNNETPA